MGVQVRSILFSSSPCRQEGREGGSRWGNYEGGAALPLPNCEAIGGLYTSKVVRRGFFSHGAVVGGGGAGLVFLESVGP